MYKLNIHSKKSLFEQFFDNRSSLILQFGNGDLSKKEFLEQNFDLVKNIKSIIIIILIKAIIIIMKKIKLLLIYSNLLSLKELKHTLLK